MSASQTLCAMDRIVQQLDNAVINRNADQAGQYGEALAALVDFYRVQRDAECGDCQGRGSIETRCRSRECIQSAVVHTHPVPCTNAVTHR